MIVLLLLVLAGIAGTAAGFAIWGVPVLVLSLIGFAVYLAFAKKEEGIGTMEKTRGPEPTGRPRMATGSAETANERQGQV
ncbi:MAG TPA: hypothetical protein VF533_18810 [Solirubrobacteraceae bacterium]